MRKCCLHNLCWLLIVMVWVLPYLPAAEVLAQAKLIKAEAERKNSERAEAIAIERNQLMKEHLQMRAQIEAVNANILKINEESNAIKQHTRELSKQLREANYEKQLFHDALKQALDELRSLIDFSLGRFEVGNELRTFPENIDLELLGAEASLDKLLEAGMLLMRSAASTSLGDSRFSTAEVGEMNGRVFRLGEVQAYGWKQNDAWALMPMAGSHLLHGRQLPSGLSLQIINHDSQLPLDMSAGRLFLHGEKLNMLQKIKAGGPMVWPILLLAVLAIIYFVERWIVLLRLRTGTDDLLQKVLALIENREFAQAEKYCENKSAAAARVLLSGLQHRELDKAGLESAMEESILHEMPHLEKHLSYLAVIAAAAPLLGLLGTVTGMISTFDMISIFGTGDPQVLSGGISEALITTQLGLMVAVPVLLVHNYLSSRVDAVVADMERMAATLLNRLHLSDSAGDLQKENRD